MPRNLYVFFAVQVVLAVVPVWSIKWYPSLPDGILFFLTSIQPSQIMLLSIWLGLTPGFNVRKIAAAIMATCFLVVVSGIHFAPAVNFADIEINRTILLFGLLNNCAWYLAELIVFSLVMVAVRRKLGIIRRIDDNIDCSRKKTFQYSFFSLLTLLSLTALILAVVHAFRFTDGPPSYLLYLAYLALKYVVFAINMLAALWATLGIGKAPRRIAVVFFVSVILGFSVALAGPFGSFFREFTFSKLISLSYLAAPLVVPTVIVVFSLLFFRRRGFRLVQSAQITALAPVVCGGTRQGYCGEHERGF
jgi:hypothetical protein